MDDIQILRQMIKDEAVEPLEDYNNKKNVTLKEPKKPKLSLNICNLPQDSIVVKADSFNAPDSFFKGQRGECKRSDYFIISDTDKKKVIVCIELTETKKDTQEVVQQLSGTACLVEYCKAVGEFFWSKKGFLKNYQYRYVFISKININKRRTSYSREKEKHNKPKKMLKIFRPPNNLQFNQIAGSL